MEAPIIRTCSLILAASLFATPALASPGPERLDLFFEARTAEALGDRERAAELYVELVESGAADDTLAANALTEAIGIGRFDLARRIAAVERHHDAYNMDGRLWLLMRAIENAEKDGDFSEALTLLTEDVRVSYDFIAPFVRGWAGVANKKAATQDHGLSQLTGMGDELPLRIHAPEQLGYMLLLLSRPDEALPYIEQRLAGARGREAALRLAYADGLAHAGALDEALRLLEGDDGLLVAARKRLSAGKSLGMRIEGPADGLAQLMVALAVQLNNASDPRLPLSFAQLARSVDPQDAEASVVTALLLDAQDRTDEALATLHGVRKTTPLKPQLRDTELQVLLNADRDEEALAIAMVDTERSPALPGVWARLGDAYSNLERWSEAADAYARERTLNPDDWTVLFLEAVAHNEAGDWETSKGLLNSAMALAPQEPVIMNYLGYISLEKGEDLERADALIRAASALAPRDPSITDSLGWAYYKLGRYEQAVEILARAARLDPLQAEIHEHHGDALWKAGRRIEARFAWQAALTTAEEEDRITRLDDKLQLGLTDANAAP
ncbi:tetratricopeptide repeat protein [Sphingomicrobium clamense]|uniref:Tetratricopeptide repeat protein n=1 Tax=Sphingomicrobium clamense TaxID=2851013 RepID=A0ABS6V6G0_9SPHN|nr:tetratricopeptide repeat protein [Sphingomicrobium sp. B8]